MKLTAFRNQIRNYMTIANTGHLMDFYPYLDESTYFGATKYAHAPDMLYTFRNIGKARVNGVELEVKQRLNDHAKLKVGYTYLDAVNKTNPDMPKRLLDKPMHKLDLGLELEDKVSGWSGNIWTDYYYGMLDSNSVAGGGNYITSQVNPENNDKSIITYEFNTKKTADMYKKKTYGIWNMIVQKKIDKDSLVYFGMNNLFNHRDDDRALQGRQFRFGMNLKFGSDGSSTSKHTDAKAVAMNGTTPITEHGVSKAQESLMLSVLESQFDQSREKGATVVGDIRFGGDSHLGSDRPANRVTAVSSISDGALKNLQDKNEHGFHSRLRLGVDARVGDHTNVKVVATAQGQEGVDASHVTTGSKGLSHSRLETIDVTNHHAKWDFSVGRLTEKFGMTGYWFNKEFDGLRSVWTSDKDQLRIGYGDFRHSTGIEDSAYTHAIFTKFKRPPTVDEFVGTTFDYTGLSEEEKKLVGGAKVEKVVKDAPNTINFYQQLKALQGDYKSLSEKKETFASDIVALKDEMDNEYIADTPEKKEQYRKDIEAKTKELEEVTTKLDANIDAQYDVVSRMQEIVLKAYGHDKGFKKYNVAKKADEEITVPIKLPDIEFRYTGTSIHHDEDEDTDYEDPVDSNTFYTKPKANPSGANLDNPLFKLKISDSAVMGKDRKEYLKKWFESNKEEIIKAYKERAMEIAKNSVGEHGTVKDITFKDEDLAKAGDALYEMNYLNVGTPGESTISKTYQSGMYPYLVTQYFNEIVSALEATDGHSKLPREAFIPYTGAIIPAEGIVLQRDVIPPIKRAGYVQLRHMVGKQLGLTAWYLRSMGNDTNTVQFASGLGTSSTTFKGVANVVGIGAKYSTGNASVSFDYGQNRTDFGRFMNGRTVYNYVPGSINFTPTGRTMGGNPSFWVVRFDIGQSDYKRAGSWNGFIDYKRFDHGSFFGGNGSGSVPDRYLDGISSFTVGGGYVPRKDFLLEAFYTFDAKATGQRDTLYGGENFKLGNYTRIQGTYKF